MLTQPRLDCSDTAAAGHGNVLCEFPEASCGFGGWRGPTSKRGPGPSTSRRPCAGTRRWWCPPCPGREPTAKRRPLGDNQIYAAVSHAWLRVATSDRAHVGSGFVGAGSTGQRPRLSSQPPFSNQGGARKRRGKDICGRQRKQPQQQFGEVVAGAFPTIIITLLLACARDGCSTSGR